ncbi:TetR/AcrR family transcriptional regulator [Paenibacillus sp. FSL R5-0887]|uniref:TetR family transcriptional regulator n=1 Tax=Paenibacillus odorifer TaxID=189426 RepID=A0ABX3GPZ6_9BACL|nr:TetR/AcrR family transcriptional regulator [Paenibacillus odorifer]OMC75456.1 TetR family transcriptional regulator [Paenibacillus odorifer]OMC77905.1 TetR family transcriptional regulator [Paenibacillus odorifer]OMD32879.1 TetR family transcriptional regulator [Paenibacillus odorifer]OMD69557.1 TetR family transcriptional regulator [Paenibacillus odorifer]OMD80190.1 TetR family transcriptional regulator [Paenibacillus odorifer]
MEDKKTKIYECAKELFSNKGFKDTNVSGITTMAGIAVGSFYNYYPSKEKLFMDIFLEENEKLKKSCMQSLDMSQSPLALIRQMMVLNLEGMIANPILKEWYNKSVFAKIEQLYREETNIQVNDFLYDSFHEIIKQWQADGKMRSDMDSKMIMMIFGAMINVETHKEEIGLEYFPQLLDNMLELIMKGLTDCP